MSDNVTPLNPPTVFLRLDQVQDRVGLKTTAIYARIKEKAFPAPVSLGGRAVGWVSSEIEKWQQERIAERGVQ